MKKTVADLNLTLEIWKNSKFLLCSRSKGSINPGSMRMVGLDDALKDLHFHIWSNDHLFISSGLYVQSDDGFTNVHRQLRSMVRRGLIEIADHPDKKDYLGTPQKTLYLKENV